MQNFQINRDDTLFLMIDIQDRLFSAMQDKICEMLIKNSQILLTAAMQFKIPVIVTEQYRKGLGITIPELADLCPEAPNLEKLFFNCIKDDAIKQEIQKTGKRTVIIAGIESHICVFQTALTLLEMNYNVIIASDGVASRRKHDWKTALKALSKAGASVMPTETIAFMLIEKAGTPEFKFLSPLFK
ncbi:MAG TPA: hydrolase [Spirochaetota bacterium]|nr:hydrolase [Spirochaetota bacterium]HPJ36587.1 hydrolase [Spirochaetota bacterium]